MLNVRLLYDKSNINYLISSSPIGVPCITDCVIGELEKLGTKFRVAHR